MRKNVNWVPIFFGKETAKAFEGHGVEDLRSKEKLESDVLRARLRALWRFHEIKRRNIYQDNEVGGQSVVNEELEALSEPSSRCHARSMRSFSPLIFPQRVFSRNLFK